MTIDMSQFHGVFLEESAEHLNEIEHLLMAIDHQSPDLEELNGIFRAAHSIKGGSAIFGFEALTNVTHGMENIFDKARRSEFQFSDHAIDQLLHIVDVLRQLLASYASHQPIDMTLVASATGQLEVLLDDAGFGFFPAENPPVQEPQPDLYRMITDDGFGFFTDETPEASVANLQSTPQDLNIVTNEVVVETSPDIGRDLGKSKLEFSESATIRVDIHKVDSLVNLVGELVITQSMLALLSAEVDGVLGEKLQVAMRELERNTRDMQESIMSIRMLPISFVFNRFPRVVRDISAKLHKQVDLVIAGGSTEIDKSLIEKLVDPLTHLVRNSLDHGIEAPDIRSKQGKPSTGTITLSAAQQGGNIVIVVSDDGAGLARDKILSKAKALGLVSQEWLSDEQLTALIMSPGFSTASQITDVSGRGVGLDVVKRNIESMGGTIHIHSVANQGTQFHIRLPLTLAIVDGMIVSAGSQQFIIPLVNIVESMQPNAEHLKLIGNQPMLELRNTYWPIVCLHELMAVTPQKSQPTEAILVLMEASNVKFALMVDDLIGQQQVVIKSLEQHYQRVPGIAGATIMGDGSVALILDAESLCTAKTATEQGG